ncbi:MAG: c-type cytochrome [Gammaproteobacteria bacterium]|nr:c-type cytochrome [Gammaproteobacteria bacterium]
MIAGPVPLRSCLTTVLRLLPLFGIAAAVHAAVDGPGDFRGGYESPDYETRSIALAARSGQPADLVGRMAPPPLGLPPLEAGVLPTSAQVALGRKLFYDRRLSLNGTQSCGMCHIPEQGFTNNELATAVGFEGRDVGRNTPTLYNVAYRRVLFHDARENSLEHQAWQPVINPVEMANPSIGRVLHLLRSLPDYDGLFGAAFDGRGADMETFGKAIASYQRTLLSGNSPFDRWYFGGDEKAVDASVKRGFALFTGKGACASCHLLGESHAVFTDDDFHNTGVGYGRAMRRESPTQRVILAPGVFVDVPTEVVASVSRPGDGNDIGRYEVTGDPDDRWRFLTPTLRNVAITAPYMHDGSLRTLEAVVDFYDAGGEANPGQDPRIRVLGLNASEKADLLAFLRSLTGENETLVLDAFAAPVGDVGDP